MTGITADEVLQMFDEKQCLGVILFRDAWNNAQAVSAVKTVTVADSDGRPLLRTGENPDDSQHGGDCRAESLRQDGGGRCSADDRQRNAGAAGLGGGHVLLDCTLCDQQRVSVQTLALDDLPIPED